MKLRIFVLPVLLAFLSITGNCQTPAHGANLSWNSVGVSGATYTVLRSSTSGGAKTTIKSGITGTSVTDSLSANTAACYTIVTSVPGMTDSAPSNEICGVSGKDSAPSVSGFAVTFF